MTIQQVTELGLKYLSESEESVVPFGYKQTEVGVIPEDWKIVCLDQLSEKIMVGIASAATHAYRDRGIPFLRNQNILPNKLDETDILFITPEYELTFQNKRLKAGDLLTARTGYPGTTCIVPESYSGAQSFTTLITRLKVGEVIPQYVSAYMNSESGKKFFELNQIGGGQKNVNSAILKTLLLPLPSVKEQTAIATALSDVDALIGELEKLITKKQAIKTATMQQLLTGRTRLSQFALREDGSKKGYKQSELGAIPEDWEAVPLSQVMSIRHGKSQKNVESVNGIYPIFATGGQIGTASSYLYDKPSVLIGRKGTINKPKFVDTPFWTVDTLFYSEISKHADVKFIFYKFCMVDWMQYNEASGVPSLNASTIENVVVSLPEYDEQVEIAVILSDMDEELQLLEQRLSKTHQIKQGMMQELLTGKIRLVKPEGDHHGSA